MTAKELIACLCLRFQDVFRDGDDDDADTLAGILAFVWDGDLGQLGPFRQEDLHVPPPAGAGPLRRLGYEFYRSIEDVIVLTKVMRQDPEERRFIEFLDRQRMGEVTDADWSFVNGRSEERPRRERPEYMKEFDQLPTTTLHGVWRDAHRGNRAEFRRIGNPVARIHSKNWGGPCCTSNCLHSRNRSK